MVRSGRMDIRRQPPPLPAVLRIVNIRERKRKKIEKKNNKKANYALQHGKNRLSVYVGEERLASFMMEVPIIQKTVHWLALQINGLVSLRQKPLS